MDEQINRTEPNQTVALSLSATSPCPQPSKQGNFKACSLTVPTIFVITHMTDGGTLPDQVSGRQVQVPSFPPIVLQGLMFQDWPTVLKGWALATQQGSCYVCVHTVMIIIH
jgi:hypothetical protein